MTTVKSFVERRKHKRLRAEERTLAEFQKPRLVKSVPIADISFGGIGFQYTAGDLWPINFNTLTISNVPDEIRIDYVLFKTVSDFPIFRLANSKSMRRYGVKFGELTSEQISKRPIWPNLCVPDERDLRFASTGSNFNPRNTPCIPAVKIFAFLDIEPTETF